LNPSNKDLKMLETVSPVVFMKRLAITVLLVNLFIIILAGFSIRHSRLQYEERATITTLNLAQVLDEYINGIITKTDVALLSVIDEAERQFASGGINRQALNAYILRQHERVTELAGLRMTNARGDVIYGNTIPSGARVSIADRDYFISSRNDAKGHIFISKPVVSRISKKWTINIARRLNNPDGSFAGVVYGTITLESFAKMFSRINVGKRGAIVLFDNELSVICRYPEPQGTGSIIGKRMTSAELRELFKSNQTSATYRTRSTIDGIDRTLSYRKISSYPLYILVGLANDDYLAAWWKETVQISAMVTLFSLVLFCLAWLLYHYVVALKRAEKKLLFTQFAVDHASDAICWIGLDARFRYVNDSMCSHLGYSREELLTMTIHEIDPTLQKERWPVTWEEVKQRKLQIIETLHRTKDGRYVPVEVAINHHEFGGEAYHCCFVRDITKRKKLEEALKRSHEELELKVSARTSELKAANDRLRNLAAHLQSVREEERTNIARDIHDELGQALTAMKMELSWFRNKYGDHKGIFDKSNSMLDALDATILSVKRICTELRPSILDHFGLVAAMEWQANEFKKRSGIECIYSSEPDDIELDKERSTVLFRIFQEAFTNVLKHANATKVTARLILKDDHVILEIADNGIGITDEQLSKPQAFGLIGMRERVYPWGGKVEITGEKGGGTTVKVIMPLSIMPLRSTLMM
jgi:PAS domain S-box-containing protein